MIPDFKIGQSVTHIISDNRMVVLAVSSDDMVSCRYIDGNGVFQSQ